MKTFIGQILAALVFVAVIFTVLRLLHWLTH
jgi:hypothetical protein